MTPIRHTPSVSRRFLDPLPGAKHSQLNAQYLPDMFIYPEDGRREYKFLYYAWPVMSQGLYVVERQGVTAYPFAGTSLC